MSAEAGKWPGAFMAAALLILAGAALFTSGGDVDLSTALDLWRPGPELRREIFDLAGQRAAYLPPDDPEFLSLAAAYSRALEERYGQGSHQALGEAEARFREQAAAFIRTRGPQAYAAAGQLLAWEFLKALTLAWQARGGEHLGKWLAANPDNPAAKKLRLSGGEFPERALASGLLPAEGPLDPDRMLVAGILWLGHWLDAGRGGFAEPGLSRAEELLLLKWKIEDAAHLPAGRKAELVRAVMEMDPEYPGDYMLGILALMRQDAEEAEEHFRAALEQDELPRRSAAWLRLLENHSW